MPIAFLSKVFGKKLIIFHQGDLILPKRLINKLIENEIDSKLEEPAEGDLKLYYEANKDKYTEEKKDAAGKITNIQKEFEQVKDKVQLDYMSMKRQEKVKGLLDNLRRTKDVIIYD